VSDFPILCKYLLRGKWPQRSCSIVLDCFRVSVYNFLINVLYGKEPPSCSIRGFLGELSHFVSHLVFSPLLKSCLSAEALVGSGRLRMWGRLAIALDRPVAASFAILSTSSFPFTLL